MTGRGRRAGTATVATSFAVVLFVAASGIAGAGRGSEEATSPWSRRATAVRARRTPNADGASSRRPASIPRRRRKTRVTESALLSIGWASVQIRIEESRKPSTLSTPRTRCRPKIGDFRDHGRPEVFRTTRFGRGAACSACFVGVRREHLALSVHQDPVGQPAETDLLDSPYLNTAVLHERGTNRQ